MLKEGLGPGPYKEEEMSGASALIASFFPTADSTRSVTTNACCRDLLAVMECSLRLQTPTYPFFFFVLVIILYHSNGKGDQGCISLGFYYCEEI